jgi:hypothetical protein
MEKILEYLLKIFSGFGKEKQFVFNFTLYDGTERTTSISDTNVVEYEFVNLGTTMVYINDMPLYPDASGKHFNRIKLLCSFNEMDVTIYKYRFEQPDFFLYTAPVTIPAVGDVLVPKETPPGAVQAPAYISNIYNRLLVISKVKAYKRNQKPS